MGWEVCLRFSCRLLGRHAGRNPFKQGSQGQFVRSPVQKGYFVYCLRPGVFLSSPRSKWYLFVSAIAPTGTSAVAGSSHAVSRRMGDQIVNEYLDTVAFCQQVVLEYRIWAARIRHGAGNAGNFDEQV
eukprot:760334-Hanusia_phi.AAC.3